MKLPNLSIRQAAYHTLSRYCKIPEEDYLHENIVIPKIQVACAKSKQIFTKSQEQQLGYYILFMFRIFILISLLKKSELQLI